MPAIAPDALAHSHSNGRLGQWPDAGGTPDAVHARGAGLGAKRGAGPGGTRAAKRLHAERRSPPPTGIRLVHMDNGLPRVVRSESDLATGDFNPMQSQDLSLSQRVKLLVMLLKNIFSKDAYSNWQEKRYETRDRDKFEQLLDHLDDSKTLTARDLANFHGSLKGPVAKPGSGYVYRAFVENVQRMNDLPTLRLLKDQLERLQGAREPSANDGLSGAEGGPVDSAVAACREGLSVEIDRFCQSVLGAVSLRLARVKAQAGIDDCMAKLAASLQETDWGVYRGHCEILLSSVNQQVGAYEDATAVLQKRHGNISRKVAIPALALDKAVLDGALRKLFGDAGVTGDYSSTVIGEPSTLILSNVLAQQEWLVGQLDRLVPYSDLLGEKASELAQERYAAHEAQGAQVIRDIMAAIAPAGVLINTKELPSLAGGLRRVLNVIRHTTDKRAQLLPPADGKRSWEVPPPLVAAFQSRDGLQPLWQALAFGVRELRAEVAGGLAPGAIRNTVPVEALQMLDWLSDLVCQPCKENIGSILGDADEHAWRTALIAEMGLVVSDQGGRVLSHDTQRLQKAFRSFSEGAAAASRIEPQHWQYWKADPDSTGPGHAITRYFEADAILRTHYRYAVTGVDSNGQRIVAAARGGPGHEAEIHDLLTAMDNVLPGSVRKLMPYMDQSQFAFIQGGLQTEGRCMPGGDQYSGVSFTIDMRANGDVLMEIEARFDAIKTVLRPFPSGQAEWEMVDPNRSRAMFRKCILVSECPDGKLAVRQLGPVAFSMTVAPLDAPQARAVADDDFVLDPSFSLIEPHDAAMEQAAS